MFFKKETADFKRKLQHHYDPNISSLKHISEAEGESLIFNLESANSSFIKAFLFGITSTALASILNWYALDWEPVPNLEIGCKMFYFSMVIPCFISIFGATHSGHSLPEKHLSTLDRIREKTTIRNLYAMSSWVTGIGYILVWNW